MRFDLGLGVTVLPDSVSVSTWLRCRILFLSDSALLASCCVPEGAALCGHRLHFSGALADLAVDFVYRLPPPRPGGRFSYTLL